jgi:alanyl-tRNA synthetase
MPIGEAQAMGAMALFGEKYGETVRVVQFGTSAELCGGTHVQSTGNIGMVRIISESSIAAGIRRIEAITGEAVEKLLDSEQDILAEAKEILHNTPDILNAIRRQAEENTALKKEVEAYQQEKIMQLRKELLADAVEVNGIKTIRYEGSLTADQAKTLAFQIRNLQNTQLFFVAGCVHEGKPSLTVLLSDDLVEKGLNAVTIAREAAKEIQGGGGGQAFFASAGGRNAAGIKQAVEKAVGMVHDV